jgi:hypothetical protein
LLGRGGEAPRGGGSLPSVSQTYCLVPFGGGGGLGGCRGEKKKKRRERREKRKKRKRRKGRKSKNIEINHSRTPT